MSGVHRYVKALLITILLLGLAQCALSQNSKIQDSLTYELEKSSGSKKVKILADLFWLYRVSDIEKAEAYSQESLAIAIETGDQEALANAYHICGVMKIMQGNLTEAKRLLNFSLEAASEISDSLQIASALNSLGILSQNQSDYNQALEYFMKRIPFLKPTEKGAIATNYNNIGRVHEAIGNNPKALEYFLLALDLHRSISNKRMEGGTLTNIGVVYFNMKDYNKALEYYQQSVPIVKQSDDKGNLSILYESIGNVYKVQEKYGEAIRSYTEALSISREIQDGYGIASVTMNLGETFLLTRNYGQAAEHLLKSYELSRESGDASFVMRAEKLLAQLYLETNDHPKAYQHLNAYQVLKDSVFNETKNKQIQELQTKYETEKKDQEIILLNKETELQTAALKEERIIRNVSILGLLLIAVIAFLMVKSYRQKSKASRQLAEKNEELSRQRITQLEKDQKLGVMAALMEGEEKERKRIAKDLHDGLSGLLAAAKMQFDSVQQETATTQSHATFSNAIQSLDHASHEVRRIAHNMMPEILMKYGLVDALTEFIANIKAAHHINITYTHRGMDERQDQIKELTLYRIIQELVNNIVKHASATEVLIQLNNENGLLLVTVEDNGVGFDMKALNRSTGIGMSNIKSRAQYLGAQLTIDSTPGKGTSVYIEIELNNKMGEEV